MIGDDSPIIAPREFRPHLPKTFPYDFVHAVDVLLDYRGVAVHKGLMNELPVPVLRTLREEWKCDFANEVFLFFMPPSCSLPSTSGQHLGAFDENLALLEKKVVALQSHPNKETACVVSASRAPAALEAVLRSLSLLHLAVVVVPHTTDENLRRAFRDLCLGYRTRLESVVGHKKPAPGDAIRTGVRRVLAEDWMIPSSCARIFSLPWKNGGMRKPARCSGVTGSSRMVSANHFATMDFNVWSPAGPMRGSFTATGTTGRRGFPISPGSKKPSPPPSSSRVSLFRRRKSGRPE